MIQGRKQYWKEEINGLTVWKCRLCGPQEHHTSSGPAKMMWHDDGKRVKAPTKRRRVA